MTEIIRPTIVGFESYLGELTRSIREKEFGGIIGNTRTVASRLDQVRNRMRYLGDGSVLYDQLEGGYSKLVARTLGIGETMATRVLDKWQLYKEDIGRKNEMG